MSTPGPMLENDRVATPEVCPVLPDEQTVWQRYSAHHEFPISTLATVTIYGFAVLLIIALGAVALRWSIGPISPVVTLVNVVNEDDPNDDREGGSGLGNGPDARNAREEWSFRPDNDDTKTDTKVQLDPDAKQPLNDGPKHNFAIGPRSDSTGNRDDGGSGFGRGNKVCDGTGKRPAQRKDRLARK